MFAKLSAAVDRLRSEKTTADQRAAQALKSREEAEEQSETAEEQSRSGLFHCPSCDTVYVATEKETCSNCDGSVAKVRSTLQNR